MIPSAEEALPELEQSSFVTHTLTFRLDRPKNVGPFRHPQYVVVVASESLTFNF